MTTSTMMKCTALALLLSSCVAYDVPSLTPDNYDELTEGKTVFLKFFAPWVSKEHDPMIYDDFALTVSHPLTHIYGCTVV